MNSAEIERNTSNLNQSSKMNKEFEYYLKIQDEEGSNEKLKYSQDMGNIEDILKKESLINSTLDSKSSLQKLNSEDP